LLQETEQIETNNERNRHSQVVNLFSFVGMAITGGLGTLSLIAADLTLGFSLIGASLVYFVAYRIHRRTNDARLPAAIIVYSLYALMIFLVYSGGVEDTGPLWIFIVSPVSLFIHGLKRGLMEISIFLAIICLVLFLPADLLSSANYASAFKLRLIYAFMTVTFLSACYEYSREQSYKDTLELSKQYEQLAYTDQLTKLCNRRGALTKLELEQPRIARNKEPLSVILCDIDHFKRVNDQYGHSAGDAVLIRIGEIFTKLIREQDTIARWGGEEFLFILPQTPADNAAILAEKIHQALQNELVLFDDVSIAITVSMGIEQMNAHQAIDEVINHADKYLYEAKNAGRNQTRPTFDPIQNQEKVTISHL